MKYLDKLGSYQHKSMGRHIKKEPEVEYYQLLTHDHFPRDRYLSEDGYESDKVITIDRSDYNRIVSYFPSVYKPDIKSITLHGKKIDYISLDRKESIWKIYKLEDEYYLVGLGDSKALIYFLCDQDQGLKQCIKKSTDWVYDSDMYKDVYKNKEMKHIKNFK